MIQDVCKGSFRAQAYSFYDQERFAETARQAYCSRPMKIPDGFCAIASDWQRSGADIAGSDTIHRRKRRVPGTSWAGERVVVEPVVAVVTIVVRISDTVGALRRSAYISARPGS